LNKQDLHNKEDEILSWDDMPEGTKREKAREILQIEKAKAPT